MPNSGRIRFAAGASILLMLAVVAASAYIRAKGGSEVQIARGVHRAAASSVALLVSALLALAWRQPRLRAAACVAFVLMLALSAVGWSTGTTPPPAAAFFNQSGGFVLTALLAWIYGRAAGQFSSAPDPRLALAALALAGFQAAFGGTLAIYAPQASVGVLITHAASGIAAAAAVAALGWRYAACAALAPALGVVSVIFPGAAAQSGHALAGVLLLALAAYARARAAPPTPRQRGDRPRALSAHQAFYPAAALYAAIALPASVFAMTAGVFPALAEPAGHAHEMLLGFALAVVAGNQLGAVRSRSIAAMLLLWIAARGAFLLAPESGLAGALNAAFAGALAFHVVPRLFGSAKKLRNQALPAVLTALCAAAAYWQFARHVGGERMPQTLALAIVMLFALLMLFMGGRIVAPAVAGQLYRQGERLDARVQPRLEAALLIASAIAAGALLAPRLQPLAAAAAATAGGLALLRLARWRLWAMRGRPDLVCLAAGYGWLGAGLLALGASLAAGRYESAAVHVITIGALGTLTFNVMAMSWMLRARHATAGFATVVWGTGLIAAATAFRLLGAFQPVPWLLVAAGCWSAAFTVLLALFWRNRSRA